MTELLEAIASWRTVLIAVAAFGFAPGFILRLAVKIYPRTNPRRQEIIADLYVMSRIERPFYVAEQLETVLFEGLSQQTAYRRLRRRAKRDLLFMEAVIEAIDSDDQLVELERIARKFNLLVTYSTGVNRALAPNQIGLNMMGIYERREQATKTLKLLNSSRPA